VFRRIWKVEKIRVVKTKEREKEREKRNEKGGKEIENLR